MTTATAPATTSAAVLAAEIAEIEPEWSVTAYHSDYDNIVRIALPPVTGGTIELFLNPHRAPGRVCVSGMYPHHYNLTTRRTPRITVALERGAAEIVKDVRRRYLPDYLVTLALANNAVRDLTDHQEATRDTMKRLAEVVGVTLKPDTTPEYANVFVNFKNKISGMITSPTPTGATLRLSVPTDLAEAILAMARDYATK